MFSTLRTRFGIPGVISVIALVFAMLGGAYAANNSGGQQTAEASKRQAKKKSKAKRGPRGPKGAKGDTGPAGPQGPAGANGNDGANGSNGTPGENGENGTNGNDGNDGVSVTTTNITTAGLEGHCVGTGGTKFVSASGTEYVCNGADGETGFTSTLPSEKTETGAWSFGPSSGELAYASLSFPIPLASSPSAGTAHYINQANEELVLNGEEIEAVPPTKCGAAVGGSVLVPKAAPGHLCMYERYLFPGTPGAVLVASSLIEDPGTAIETTAGQSGTTGARVAFYLEASNATAGGTFAVTAP